jgi:hypothetical protein
VEIQRKIIATISEVEEREEKLLQHYLAVINFIIITRQLFFISVHLSSIVSIFFLNINALI